MSKDARHVQSGLTLVEAVLLVATIAVIGFVGFAIYQAGQGAVEMEDPIINQEEDQDDTHEGIPENPELEDEDDLDAAIDDMQGIDFEEEDSGDELQEQSRDL